MERVTIYHRTALRNLPLIELDGLRTRIDLTERLGEPGPFDQVATGRFARGRRVSGWVSRVAAGAHGAALGAGVVSFTVDPRKAVANLAADRERDATAVWATARPLAAWLADAGGDVAALPADLEVHVDQPVRAKLVRLHAPDVDADELGVHAGVVAAVADSDRVAAKLLMHLALAEADGEADTPAYRAACALAWRDEPDARDLSMQVGRADAEAVLEAVLADLEDRAPEGAAVLLGVLDTLRAEADAAAAEDPDRSVGGAAGRAVDLGELMMDRSERSLVGIVQP